MSGQGPGPGAPVFILSDRSWFKHHTDELRFLLGKHCWFCPRFVAEGMEDQSYSQGVLPKVPSAGTQAMRLQGLPVFLGDTVERVAKAQGREHVLFHIFSPVLSLGSEPGSTTYQLCVPQFSHLCNGHNVGTHSAGLG